jgi:hypothetical protein
MGCVLAVSVASRQPDGCLRQFDGCGDAFVSHFADEGGWEGGEIYNIEASTAKLKARVSSLAVVSIPHRRQMGRESRSMRKSPRGQSILFVLDE